MQAVVDVPLTMQAVVDVPFSSEGTMRIFALTRFAIQVFPVRDQLFLLCN